MAFDDGTAMSNRLPQLGFRSPDIWTNSARTAPIPTESPFRVQGRCQSWQFSSIFPTTLNFKGWEGRRPNPQPTCCYITTTTLPTSSTYYASNREIYPSRAVHHPPSITYLPSKYYPRSNFPRVSRRCDQTLYDVRCWVFLINQSTSTMFPRRTHHQLPADYPNKHPYLLSPGAIALSPVLHCNSRRATYHGPRCATGCLRSSALKDIAVPSGTSPGASTQLLDDMQH